MLVNVLVFLLNIAMTAWNTKRFTTTGSVLLLGLTAAGLLYLPGMITFENQVFDSYFRWWVVHLWVEGVWELIMGDLSRYLLIKLTGLDREVIEKWLYVIVGLTFLSGILGTGHHYYYIGTPSYWLWVGGVFGALEPLAFLGMALYAVTMAAPLRARSPEPHRAVLDGGLRRDVVRRRGDSAAGWRAGCRQGNRVDARNDRHRDARTHGLLGRLRR